MKNWILKRFFSKELAEERRQGSIEAFPLAQKDLLDTFNDDVEKRAEELSKIKLAALLSPINAEKIITFNPKQRAIFLGGERITDSQLANLKAEADFFATSELWKILHETPKELAQRAMFVEGDSLDTMKKGRIMLYTLDTQNRIVKAIQGYTQATLDTLAGN